MVSLPSSNQPSSRMRPASTVFSSATFSVSFRLSSASASSAIQYVSNASRMPYRFSATRFNSYASHRRSTRTATSPSSFTTADNEYTKYATVVFSVA